jgi:PAS domain S-box-containing protein
LRSRFLLVDSLETAYVLLERRERQSPVAPSFRGVAASLRVPALERDGNLEAVDVIDTVWPPSADDRSASDLGAFLRTQRAALLESWNAAARRAADHPVAGVQARTEFFDGLLEAVESGSGFDAPAPTPQPGERYGLRRLAEGAALRQVMSELAGLRDVVFDHWTRAHGAGPAGAALRRLNHVVDSSSAAAAERYLTARDRTLKALDRVSSVAIHSRRLDDVLQGLLDAIVEPAAAVDTASILLREGDALVVKAAVGLEEELRASGFTLRIGEGFSGRIAAERRARLVTGDQIEAETVSPFLRARRLRVLYGVPLQSDGQLVGVAHIGSSTMASFSDQDRWLFEAMCVRATAAIDQHLRQQAHANQVQELETVLHSIPDPVFVADARGVHHANRAALQLFGVDSVERLNRSAASLAEVVDARHADTGQPFAPDERPIAKALRGETTVGEITVRHLQTGRDVILQCAVAPVRTGDGIIAAVAACSDITARKEQDAERDRLYREARQAVADRQHVLGVVSHDLRNPLNSIVLAAETLKDDGISAELRTKALAMITRAATRMNRMISDLLDVNSIEAGRLALHPLPQDPLSVVDEVWDMFAPQAKSRGLALVKDAPTSLPLVRGDRHRLIQVLANLVSNAFKATSQGTVTIKLEHRDQDVVFAVADNGPGVPEDVRATIFEPYWRAERATYKGTGLGLAIARGIVESHGGRIWIESEPGRGATFLFSIPTA